MFFTLDNNVPERRDVDMFLTFFKNFLKFLWMTLGNILSPFCMVNRMLQVI